MVMKRLPRENANTYLLEIKKNIVVFPQLATFLPQMMRGA